MPHLSFPALCCKSLHSFPPSRLPRLEKFNSGSLTYVHTSPLPDVPKKGNARAIAPPRPPLATSRCRWLLPLKIITRCHFCITRCHFCQNSITTVFLAVCHPRFVGLLGLSATAAATAAGHCKCGRHRGGPLRQRMVQCRLAPCDWCVAEWVGCVVFELVDFMCEPIAV